MLQSLLLGIGIGLVYDILRAVRRHFACGRAATAVLDAVFWIVLTAGLFEFGLVFAAGQPRFFVLVGVLCGALLYFMLLSSAVLLVLAAVLGAAARVWSAAKAAARVLQIALWRTGMPEKIRHYAKKIQKPSSIFRRKGLK